MKAVVIVIAAITVMILMPVMSFAAPELRIESNHVTVDDIYEGQKLVHTFLVKNSGDSDLLIKKVTPG